MVDGGVFSLIIDTLHDIHLINCVGALISWIAQLVFEIGYYVEHRPK